MAVRIVKRGKHVLVIQGGVTVGAFPASDREALGQFLRRLTGREAAEATSPKREAEGKTGRSRGQPAGGDGAVCWPEWARDWVWSPHETTDPETLIN